MGRTLRGMDMNNKKDEGDGMGMPELHALLLTFIAMVVRGMNPFERALATQNHADLEDFGQDMVVETLARLSRSGRPDAYWLEHHGLLYGMVIYAKFQMLRRRWRRAKQPRPLSFDLATLAASTPVEPPASESWRAAVRQAVSGAGLSDVQRTSLELWMDGMTLEEIGRKTGVTRQSAANAISRALARLSMSPDLRRLFDDTLPG